MAHPSINARIQKLGTTYEKQHQQARKLSQNMVAFFGHSQEVMKRLMAENDKLLVMRRKSKLAGDVLAEQTKLSDQIAELTVKHQSKFKELVESRPLLNVIFDFEDRLFKDLQMLEILSTMEQQSKHVLSLLEEEHQKLKPLLETLEQRLKNCKKHLAEIDQFSQHMLN